MFEVLNTSEYQKWVTSLADMRAQALITARVERLALGNPGNIKSLGDGVSELKIISDRDIAFTLREPARPWCCSSAAATSFPGERHSTRKTDRSLVVKDQQWWTSRNSTQPNISKRRR